jgi:exopolysaccharide production protein ExoY
MEHLILILAAALTLIGGAFSKLLADEFKAWAPSMVSSILAVAVRTLPPSRRKRSEEEWKSHVEELPGDLSKVIVACGFMFAACRLRIVWRIAAEPFSFSKRVVDIALALSGIILLAPILIVASVLTVVSSPGPALSRQRRIGLRGRPIDVFKFRVADGLKRPVSDSAAEGTATRAPRHDLRLTAIGAVLRKTRFEGLPQLFNVLKGDMSIVGPRPITDGDLEKYSAAADAYLSCRPGMTGLWQVSGGSTTTYVKRVVCDVYYSHNWSMVLDARILIVTLPALLLASSADEHPLPTLQDDTTSKSRYED